MSESLRPDILPTDSLFGRYRVIKKLGAGGMGEVYLAEDIKLERKVALKILPADVASNQERMRRFDREAKAASALNHPNIITIHEIGESEGIHYIATEFIEGETLYSRLKEKSLSIKSALDIAVQIVSALQVAHSANIIHRDIKPENVMIRSDGLVKILDFGIAKLSEPPALAGGLQIDEEAATAIKVPSTDPGMIIGTANYMSPEQAKGQQIDARSDIFSVGIVMYEMLSGRRAFAGESAWATIAAILHTEPKPLRQILSDIPPEIERIVGKTLRKDRDERYQTARGLLTDLKDVRRDLEFREQLDRTSAPNLEEPKTEIQTAPPTDAPPQRATSGAGFIAGEIKKHNLGVAVALIILTALLGAGFWFFFLRAPTGNAPIDSIAVLPFVNNSSNPDSEYLSDGLAESLIFRLSQLPDLKVSPTSSVFRYKGKETDAQKIGSELGVKAVLSGRTAQRGDQLTISLELIDVRNNKLIWGERYERKVSELLQTQREIATAITQKLQLKLSAGGERGLAKKYTDNNEAYQLYLKGRFHWAKRTKDDLLKAIEYYKQAINLDPNFALAFVGIATSYNSMGKDPDVAPREAIPQAKAAATRALEIDPSLAEAHSALADSLAIYDWNWRESERHFKRAIELDPNVSYIHVAYGLGYSTAAGRADEVVAELERALELEPLAMINNSVLVSAYIYARQNEKALRQAHKAYDLDPNFPLARIWLGLAYVANEKYDDAVALGEDGLQKSPSNPNFLYFTAYAYAKQGRRREAEQFINRLKEAAKTRYVRTYYIACIYAALGDKDRAFAELERSYEDKDCFLARARIDPAMDPLRDDPRFRDLLRRLNLPE